MAAFGCRQRREGSLDVVELAALGCGGLAVASCIFLAPSSNLAPRSRRRPSGVPGKSAEVPSTKPAKGSLAAKPPRRHWRPRRRHRKVPCHWPWRRCDQEVRRHHLEGRLAVPTTSSGLARLGGGGQRGGGADDGWRWRAAYGSCESSGIGVRGEHEAVYAGAWRLIPGLGDSPGRVRPQATRRRFALSSGPSVACERVSFMSIDDSSQVPVRVWDLPTGRSTGCW